MYVYANATMQKVEEVLQKEDANEQLDEDEEEISMINHAIGIYVDNKAPEEIKFEELSEIIRNNEVIDYLSNYTDDLEGQLEEEMEGQENEDGEEQR